MRKNKGKIIRRCVGMALACMMICLQTNAMTALAATRSWKLYYNPAGPPAENVTSWREPLTATQSTSRCTYRCNTDKAKVSYVIENTGQGCTFPDAGNAYPASSFIKGHVYTYSLKYSYTANILNSPNGTITY